MALVAHIRSIPRKQGEKFLRKLAQIVESEEAIRLLLPDRPKHERAAVAAAQDMGAAWVRALLPELIRMLPPQ